MIRFTRHARNRLRFWRLSETDVTHSLAQPDLIAQSIYSRRNAWKRIGGRWVRVTYLEEGQDTLVITVTIRRRGPLEEE